MTSQSQLELYQKRRRLVFNAIRDAALASLPCPTNQQLLDLTGYSCEQPISRILQDFERDGMIRTEGRARARVIVSLHHGWRTADKNQPDEPVKALTRVAQFVQHAADIFNTTAKDILGPSQFREHVIPRRAISLAASNHGWNYTAIGRVLNRDHSTVIYSRKIALRDLERDPAFSAKLAELVARTEVGA